MKPKKLYDSIVDIIKSSDLEDQRLLSELRGAIVRSVVDPNRVYHKTQPLHLDGSGRVVTGLWRADTKKLVDYYGDSDQYLRVLSVPYVIRVGDMFDAVEATLDTHMVSIAHKQTRSHVTGINKIELQDSSRGFVATYILNPQLFTALEYHYHISAGDLDILRSTIGEDMEEVSGPYRLNLESAKAFKDGDREEFHPFFNNLARDSARPLTAEEARVYMAVTDDVVIPVQRFLSESDDLVRELNLADFALPDHKPRLKN